MMNEEERWGREAERSQKKRRKIYRKKLLKKEKGERKPENDVNEETKMEDKKRGI